MDTKTLEGATGYLGADCPASARAPLLACCLLAQGSSAQCSPFLLVHSWLSGVATAPWKLSTFMELSREYVLLRVAGKEGQSLCADQPESKVCGIQLD